MSHHGNTKGAWADPTNFEWSFFIRSKGLDVCNISHFHAFLQHAIGSITSDFCYCCILSTGLVLLGFLSN